MSGGDRRLDAGPRGSRGFILVAALLATLLLSVLGAGFALVTSMEATIAENFRDSQDALRACEAAVERALPDLDAAGSWTPVLNGTVRAAFADGVPSGVRTLSDGSRVDLTQVVTLANCRKTTVCNGADMDAVTADRPWGANNPRWQLFLYGPLSAMADQYLIQSPYYVIVLVGDDPSETDNDPSRDGSTPAAGGGLVVLRALVFGPRGSRKSIEVTVARAANGHVRVVAWRVG